MTQYAIATDLNRCVGCLSCMVACKAVNNVPIGSYWNKVLRIGPSLKEGATSSHDVEMYYLPVQCQHCADPECVKVCPCLLYTSPSPRDRQKSRMPSSA